jgi:dihydroorotase
MTETFDLIIRGGIAATPNGIAPADIAVRKGRIAAIGTIAGTAADAIDARGLHVLPGVIDTQVHFREPGLEHKEDLATGSAAAALGGVTAVFEMPNTKPGTLGAADLADKLRRAAGRVWCDIAFFIGAAADNAEQLGELENLPGCAGVKMFMGSSTGDLLVAGEADIRRVLGHGRRRLAVHSEDEARLRERFGCGWRARPAAGFTSSTSRRPRNCRSSPPIRISPRSRRRPSTLLWLRPIATGPSAHSRR